MKHIILLTFTIFSLNAMSLDETISYALEHNNALKQIDIDVKRSKEQRSIKQAQKYGRFDVIASYDHYNLSRTLVPLAPMTLASSPDGSYKVPTTKDLFSAGVSYNVILFDGFAQQNSYKISDLQYQNSFIKNKLGREELIYNVKNLYISLLTLEEQLVAQSLYTVSELRVLQKIQKQRKEGTKSKLDFLRAKNAFEASKAQESIIEANIAILRANINSILGDKEFDKTEPITIDMEKDNIKDTAGIKDLQRFKATQLNIKINEKRRKQAKSAYFPIIDFSAYYGQNFGPNDTTNTVPTTSVAPTAGSTLIDKGDWNNENVWQLGVHLKWNIFDFGSKSAKYEQSKLSYLESKLESNDVEIELKKNIITANNKIKLAKAQFYSRKSQYQLLDETEKIEQVRYDNNALTLTDLLATQANKALAKAQMINAKYEYKKAICYLEYLFEKGDK